METEHLFIYTLAARLGAWLNDVFAFWREDDDVADVQPSIWDEVEDWDGWQSDRPS